MSHPQPPGPGPRHPRILFGARSAILVLLALCAAPVAAQTWSDDFNRPPSTDLGPDWIETVGDLGIWSERGAGFTDSFAGPSKMAHVSAHGAYDQARVRVSFWGNTALLSSFAVVLGEGGARNLYVMFEDGGFLGRARLPGPGERELHPAGGANPVLANFTLNHAFLVLDVLPTLLDVPWVSGPAPLQVLP